MLKATKPARRYCACWCVLSLLGWLHTTATLASVFAIDSPDTRVIGSLSNLHAAPGDSLVDIAQAHDLGQDELLLANPALLRWIPVGSQTVVLPARFILPATEYQGLVINLPERRLYWYVRNRQDTLVRVVSFPVSVGRLGWSTPIRRARITGRMENPPWYPPASIREEAAARGIALPEVVPPGPANPLGSHALYLDLPGYLIHGTNNPAAIGLRVTHGCIRLYPDDVAQLYRYLPEDTQVHFVDQPVKTGWQDGELWLEVHPPLEESDLSDDELLMMALTQVQDALKSHPSAKLYSWLVRQAVERRDGIPVSVTSRSPVRTSR